MIALAPHYTRQDLIDAIRRSGIVAGDTVSLQASLGRLGIPDGTHSYPEMANLVIDAFLDVLGADGTLIVPCYTYSIGKGETFEVETTPSAIGEFTEIFRKRSDILRSRDPMLSSAGSGPRANRVLREISMSCYGTGSTFDRLKEVGAKICTLGVSLHWATFRHHIEEMAGVPFRFKKVFAGTVRENGVNCSEHWVYFAAPYVPNCAPFGLRLEQSARAAGLVRVEKVGRGELMCIGAEEYFAFGLREMQANPWLTAKGPACSLAELVRLEDERVGARSYSLDLSSEATLRQIVDAFRPLPRDLVSDGYDATLRWLANQLPLEISGHPTGREFAGEIVPEKWTCRDARLETMHGARLLSYADRPLIIAPYSRPCEQVVSRQELLDHVSSEATSPRAAPLGPRPWTLYLTDEEIEGLTDAEYRVIVDAHFSYGTLKVGESAIRGQVDDSILLLGRLGRSSAFDDDLSGGVVAVAVMRELGRRKGLYFSYRLILESGSIGSSAWFSDCAPSRPPLVWGLRLDSLDGDRPIAFRHSFAADHPFERCCAKVMRMREADHVIETAAFDSASRRVPIACLGRGGGFVERKPGRMAADRLDETRDLVLAIIDEIEQCARSAMASGTMKG